MDFYDDIKNVTNYIDMAKDCDASELVEILSRFLDYNSTLLEIGMGPGNDLNLLREKFVVTGSDKYEKFIETYRAKYAHADLLILDAICLETDRKFDAIYSNKVLMHLSKEELKQSLNRQRELLNDGGIVFHTFWKGEGEETYSGMLNVYYKEYELEEMFSEKYEIIYMSSYQEFERDDSIIIVAKKR